MAIFEFKLFSHELFQSVSVNAILPTPESGDYFFDTKTYYPKRGEKYQTLYLLHGFTADFSDWARFSGIERYAQKRNLAVIMPSANNSSYCNIHDGGNYYNYYTQELPRTMRALLPLSAKRENNFIAGLSMGGFGALKAALRNPENYAAVGSLSGGVGDTKDGNKVNSPINTRKWKEGAYGQNFEYYHDEKDNLRYIAKKLKEEDKTLPEIYMACGTEDFLYEANKDLKDYFMGLGLNVTYSEEKGVHDWDFWDPFIRKFIDYLPLKEGFVD